MKKLKDYLHLYLGCQVVFEDCCYDLVGINNEIPAEEEQLPVFIYNDHIGHEQSSFDEVKPILRPLSDMSNVEAHTLYSKYFGKDFALDFSGDTGSANFHPKQVRVKSEHGLRIINGDDYETGDFMKVAGIVPYLLSKHFDLFGLIESGRAIDSTTLNPKP